MRNMTQSRKGESWDLTSGQLVSGACTQALHGVHLPGEWAMDTGQVNGHGYSLGED